VADVSNAYNFLNESLRLGLSAKQLAVAEARFRLDFADRMGYKVDRDVPDFHENWEFITRLEPRNTPLDRAPFTAEELKEEAPDADEY
jgi:hypothetical protein